jgi:hypothetical protein
MIPRDAARVRRRERLVSVILSFLLATGAFFYFLLIGGGLVIALLAVAVVLVLVGTLHYAVWGRRMRATRGIDGNPEHPR